MPENTFSSSQIRLYAGQGSFEVENVPVVTQEGTTSIDIDFSSILGAYGYISGSSNISIDNQGNIAGLSYIAGSDNLEIDLSGIIGGLLYTSGSLDIELDVTGKIKILDRVYSFDQPKVSRRFYRDRINRWRNRRIFNMFNKRRK